MKCKLTRLKSNHQNLRTDTIEGQCDDLPAKGRCFMMTAPPLDPASGMRYVHTTPVLELEHDGDKPEGIGAGIVFTTRNSTYHLLYLA